ncbi:hypothetical protein K432DRAFT_425046 [Lepidopterella palustris CBS 459.81]|uniref:SPIN90/Ldb17 leucine-rich domain-containing protein n=1 Tax=Lepidopterella palustris CBS 459.81 TaxID=1314670 RepID=A0A8E2ECN8_9PEZI|nr:hypothetical protein K432DRAFT_425046 [Lepidopterella palustris CBS 459.81]
MEFEVSYSLDNEQQFWDELDDIVSANCESHELIDNALRLYLSFTTKFKPEYLQSETEVKKCSYCLLASPLVAAHREYVRRQFVYCLLQEDDLPTLHLAAAFLRYDGTDGTGEANKNDETFEMMQAEGVFPRLVELIQNHNVQEDTGLHQLLLILLYEMSRIQRLSWEDLTSVDDTFVLYLFQIIEAVSDDANDPYHSHVINVLLVLNEQYMVASTTRANANHPSPTNRVIKALSTHGMTYKTFGSDLILMLNRETETSLQLLILKLFFLLFQSPSTAEYFYTNDLHVLVDVIIRNLLDLPSEDAAAAALRHTYLRVLHPILANSQISRPPHYKRDDINHLLHILATSGSHFAPIDPTTLRLVRRCQTVPWLQPTVSVDSNSDAYIRSNSHSDSEGGVGAPETPTSPSQEKDSAIGNGQRELARRMLGMGVKGAGESTMSIVEVAAHMERPGVQTPSRGRET